MKRDITNSLSPEVRSQLDFLAKSLGQNSFFIQDTETTGIGDLDQIHDFAGLYYDNGKIYQIQYYVVQPDDIDENGFIHVNFDEIKKANKNIVAFKNMISSKDYIKLRQQMLNKKNWNENDPMITRESLADLLKNKYGRIPNFTYNAVFDIKMEKKLESSINGKIKFKEVYDVMTMSLDLMPDILSVNMGKELGRGRLEKVYKYLDQHYPKEFAKFKTPNTGAQTHTAWDDVIQYTVPVLNFMVHTLRERGFKVQTYKDVQNVWKKGGLKAQQEAKEAGLKIGLEFEDYFKQHGKDPKWAANTLAKSEKDALEVISIYNQLTVLEKKSKHNKQSDIYSPKRGTFRRVTPEQLRKNPELLKDMTIIPLKTGLNTDVYGIDDGTGHLMVARFHKSYFKNTDQAIAFGADKIYSVSEIGSTLSPYLGKGTGESWATDFGTAHHRIIEDIYKGKLKRNKNGTIDEKSLKSYINDLWIKGKTEDRYDIKGIFDEFGRIAPSSLTILNKTVNEYLKQAKELKIPESAHVEHTLGARFVVDGKTINISGTIDQFWLMGKHITLGDLKTSKEVSPQYVIQLSLYRALLRAVGQNVSKSMKIMLTPASVQKIGGVVDIEALNDKELAKFIKQSVDALEEKDPEKQAKMIANIQHKWIPDLEKHIGKQVVTGTIINDYGVEETRHFINGQSLSSIGKTLEKRIPATGYEKRYVDEYAIYKRKNPKSQLTFENFLRARISPEDYQKHLKFVEKRAKAVNDYIRTITSEADRRHVKSLLNLRGEGNTFLYDNPVFDAYRHKEHLRKDPSNKRKQVLYDILDENNNLNKEWLNEAIKVGALDKEYNKSITLGGLTVRDWINLFKSVDLGDLNNGLLNKGKLTKIQEKMLADLSSQRGAYTKAINSLIKAVLYGAEVSTVRRKGRKTDVDIQGVGGLINTSVESIKTAEDYIALRSFSASIRELSKASEKQIPKNFATKLYNDYQSFNAKQFKKIGFNDYVRHHTDQKTNKLFDAYLEKRAINTFCNLTGIQQVTKIVTSQEEEHTYEFITKSMNKHQDYLDEPERTKDTLSQFYAEEDEYAPFDAPINTVYDSYEPSKYRTIIGQLPHRIARMLTRKQLGDIVYKSMYQDYLKGTTSKTGKMSYEDFLEHLTPEQYNEYKASAKLRESFDALIKQKKGQNFLINIAKSSYLGSDEESKNLHSLIKSIYEKDPSILSDPGILHEIQQQVTGAKMEHYAKFNTKKLAELGLPLTLVGKPLDENASSRNPYKTFLNKYGVAGSGGAVDLFTKSPLFKNGAGFLIKKLTDFEKNGFSAAQLDALDVNIADITSILKDVSYSLYKYRDVDSDIDEEDFKKSSLGRIIQEYNSLREQHRGALKDLGRAAKEAREHKNDFVYITKNNKDYWEELSHKKLTVGSRYLEYELYKNEAEYNLKFVKKQILQAVKTIAQMYDILHYRAQSWAAADAVYSYKLGDETITLHGRDAIIYQLNTEVQQYLDGLDEHIRGEREDPTRAAHLALSKEEMEDMANSDITELLKEIRDALKGPGEVSGDNAAVRASITGSTRFLDPKQATADALLDAEMKAFGKMMTAKTQLSLAEKNRASDVSQIKGVVEYLTKEYNDMVQNNDSNYNMGSLKKMREARIAEYDKLTGNSMYQAAYDDFVKSEIEVLREKDRINRQIIQAEKQNNKPVADYLREHDLADAERRHAFAVEQTNKFASEHQGLNTKVRTDMYAAYAKEVGLKDAEKYQKDRIEAEQKYITLVDEEVKLKEKLATINVKIQNADPAGAEAKLLLSQRKDLNRDIRTNRGKLEEMYGSYVDSYGTTMIDGTALQTPKQALANVSKESRYRVKAAEQKSAVEDYNKALAEQVDLYKEIKSLEDQIRKSRRKGDEDTAKVLENQLGLKNKAMGGLSGNTDAAWARLKKAFPKGKIPKSIQTYLQAIAPIDELYEVKGSEADYADYKQAAGQYKTLKQRETTLLDQLHRNDLKYKTTYNKKERGALDIQGSLLGMDLEEVTQELAALEKASAGIKGFATKKAELDKQFGDIQAKNIANANVAFKGENTLFGKLTTSFKGMIYHFTQFGAAYKILGSIKQGINNVITSAKNLDKAMTDLRIVTGQTGSEAKNTMQRFAEMASQLGVTTNEVAKSATAWLRQGYSMAEVTDLVTSSMYLSKLGMISVDEATQSLTSSLKGFKLEAREAMDVVDRLTALDVKAATTAGEIATGLAQFANLASLSGVSIDQASAMVATIADVSQVSGAQAGNSLKMMLSRYGTVKSGKFSSMEGEGDTESLNDVEKVLNKIGISMRDTNNQFKEFDDVLDEIAEKWDALDNISQAAIATAVAGTRQREAFLVLMQNMDKYKRFTDISENSSGTANKKYQSYQEQLQAAQNRLAAAWEKLAQDADIAQFITIMTNFATQMVKILPDVLKTVTRLVSIWQGYKIPTALSRVANFTGLSTVWGAGKSLLTPKEGTSLWGRIKAGIATGNENILNYGSGESHRFGLGETNSWLNRIYGKLAEIQGKYGSGAKDSPLSQREEELKLTTEQLDLSKQQLTNSEKAATYSSEILASKKAETAEAELGYTYEAASTAQDQAQYVLEASSTKVKANGKTGTVATGAGKGKGAAAIAIASGAAGILSGVMTSGGTHASFATGKTVESSSEASGAMKATSAGINAVGMVGYIWGPIVGMITQTIASMLDQFLTPWLGSLLDAERDARNARVEEAEKQLNSLKTIESAVESIEHTVSSKGLTYEENQKLTEEMKGLRQTLIENSEALQRVAETMDIEVQEVFNKINDWVSLTEEEREKFLLELKSATIENIAGTTLAAAENKFNDAREEAENNRAVLALKYSVKNTNLSNTIKGTGNQDLVDAFNEWSQETGLGYTHTKQRSIYGRTTSWKIKGEGEELIKNYENWIDYLTKKDAVKYREEIQAYQKIVDDYKTTLAQLNEIYREVNENLATVALLQTKITISTGESINLMSANTAQLKRTGKQGIYDAVVNQLLANGGFQGYSVTSEEGQAIIEQAIKSNEKLYAVWTGQIYTLNEALNEHNTEALKAFATALGVSVDKLEELRNELGEIKLGDVLATPSETRDKISTITSLFTSMGSSSGLTAENLESIINKFPQLIKYLRDSTGLGTNMLKLISQYDALYARQILSDLLGNDDYYEEMMKELKETSEAAYNDLIDSSYGGVTNAQGLLGLLAGSFEESGLESKETYELLKSLYQKYFDFTTQSSLGTEAYEAYVSYWNKIWDKQITNLEEQKSALQEINKQREYENKLVEARLKLEEASKEKKRVWREGVGWAYEADQASIAEAQKNLEEVQREQTISALDQQIEELNYMKERLDQIVENKELENLKNLWEGFLGNKNLESLMSEYSVVDILNGEYGNITQILVEGVEALENYLDAQESNFNSIFGTSNSEGEYKYGSGSSWEDLKYAEQMMNYYANTKGKDSEEYAEWERRYNQSLANYQTNYKNHKSQYGNQAGWDSGITDDQRSYLDKEAIHDSYGTLVISKGANDSHKYKAGDEISPINNADLYNSIQKSANNKASGGEGAVLETWNYTPGMPVDISQKGKTYKAKEFKDNFGGNLNTWAMAVIADHPQGVVFAKDTDHSKLGIALGEGQLGAPKAGMYELKTARKGSFGMSGGPALINETGTEAIITPAGTLTALPSRTGVVPADVTRSLWRLGELAPAILRSLGVGSLEGVPTGVGPINNSDSVNIGVINMSVTADENFDPEHFVDLLKTQAALNKNNRR